MIVTNLLNLPGPRYRRLLSYVPLGLRRTLITRLPVLDTIVDPDTDGMRQVELFVRSGLTMTGKRDNPRTIGMVRTLKAPCALALNAWTLCL